MALEANETQTSINNINTAIPGQSVVIDAKLPDDVVSQPESGQLILFNMEGLIRNHMDTIGRLESEIKQGKEMLDDILAKDPTYQEHLNAANEATKTKNATKAQVMKQPQAAQLDAKIKDLRKEVKENKGSLSDYAIEYARLAKSNTVETKSGDIIEVKVKAKVSISKAFK